MDGPKVWMNGKATLGILQEPKSQTTDHLEATKTGYKSYMGHYGAVFFGATLGGAYVSLENIRERLCDDLKVLLSDPRPRLYLEFIQASYIGDLRQTEVLFDATITFFVRRWNSPEVPPLEIQRTGTARCLPEDEDGCCVKWDNSGFSGADTYLSFTIERDTTPLHAPYVHLEWRQGDIKVMMLFKKKSDTTHEELSREERVRLGIGMSNEEMTAAYALSTLQKEWVVFHSEPKIVQALDEPTKPAVPTGSNVLTRRRSRVGLGLQ